MAKEQIKIGGMPLAIWALAVGAFGIGTSEFVIMGLLPEVAAYFNVSVPSAGLLISGYALGVVIGAPLCFRWWRSNFRARPCCYCLWPFSP